MRVDVALIEYPDEGGARLLGRTDDPELVETVRARLLADREQQVDRLRRPTRGPWLRPVRGEDDGAP